MGLWKKIKKVAKKVGKGVEKVGKKAVKHVENVGSLAIHGKTKTKIDKKKKKKKAAALSKPAAAAAAASGYKEKKKKKKKKSVPATSGDDGGGGGGGGGGGDDTPKVDPRTGSVLTSTGRTRLTRPTASAPRPGAVEEGRVSSGGETLEERRRRRLGY